MSSFQTSIAYLHARFVCDFKRFAEFRERYTTSSDAGALKYHSSIGQAGGLFALTESAMDATPSHPSCVCGADLRNTNQPLKFRAGRVFRFAFVRALIGAIDSPSERRRIKHTIQVHRGSCLRDCAVRNAWTEDREG